MNKHRHLSKLFIVATLLAVACSGDKNDSTDLEKDAHDNDFTDAGDATHKSDANLDATNSAHPDVQLIDVMIGPPDSTLGPSPTIDSVSESECQKPSDCDPLQTEPDGCAEAQCVDNTCEYISIDADNDGFPTKRCTSRVSGISVQTGDDCDDSNRDVNPNGWDGPEGDGFEDGCNDDIDQDCDGLIDDGQLSNGATCKCTPNEKGKCSQTEAGDPIEYPGLERGEPLGACRLGNRECLPNGTWGACTGAVGPRQETCDGEDNDCDGVASIEDEDVVDEDTFVCDADRDDHAPETEAISRISCKEPDSDSETDCPGQWLRNPSPSTFDDCDDTDAQRNPDETERCDGKDNDCDDEVDESGSIGERVWSYDADGDGYRNQQYPVFTQCDEPSEAPTGCTGACPTDGWVDRASTPLPIHDCNDDDPTINPGGTDPCNGIDADCDGSTVTGCDCEGEETAECDTHDEDGIGTCKAGIQYCNSGKWGGCMGGQGPRAEDCSTDDLDCDGLIGNDDPDADHLKTTWYQDDDGDLYGANTSATLACSQPAVGWVTTGGDCQPSDEEINPSASEICNGVDDDCDTYVDTDDSGMTGEPSNPGVSYACQSGGWVITACPDDTAHCDTNVYNGCETDLTTLTDCRACDNQCAFSCGSEDCDEVVQLALGHYHSCTFTASGAAACWGRNLEGRLGDNSSDDRYAPEPVAMVDGFTAIAAGYQHSCGIAEENDVAYCWGDNSSRQLSLPAATEDSDIPVPVELAGGGTLQDAMSIAAGGEHSCAVYDSGRVRCWGLQSNGRLGNGVTSATSVAAVETYRNPKSASLIDNASVVVAGWAHSCIINTGDTVECWGRNNWGQLGDGSDDDGIAAVEVAGLTNVSRITAGNAHTCALSGTTMYCWGANNYNQLGPNGSGDAFPNAYYDTPQQVGLSDVTAIAAGGNFTCAVAAGAVRCWGYNSQGQRGDTNYGTSTHTPTTLSLEGITEIWAGLEHACAIRRDAPVGRNDPVFCWGSNAFGQLGKGNQDGDPHPSPTALDPLDD